ncbi:MAG: pantoate kinase [Candidatus Hermodarchaeia archaeon]|jgi:pantoate kinase
MHRLKEISAFAPGHITGFFEICDQPIHALQKGSRGSGVSISKGVTTRVQIERQSKSSIQIRMNNKFASAQVSRYVVDLFRSYLDDDYRIMIDHWIDIPIGAGLGSSGAGALSLALAFKELFNLKLSSIEAAQIAHIAEVECKTGLGTVIAEAEGGLEIRIKPGAPGIGELVQIPTHDDYVVVCLYFGPIRTDKVLSSEELRARINVIGGKLVDKLMRRPTVDNFLKFSRTFADHLGLISDRIAEVLRKTDKEGFTCSMAMFGESVFSVVKRKQVNNLLEVLMPFISSKQNLIVSDIDYQGARVI